MSDDDGWIDARQVADDLSGEIRIDVSDAHADFFANNMMALQVVQRFQPTVTYAAFIQVTRELMADATATRALMDNAIDRYLRPWRHPDRIAWPTFVPLPRLAATQDAYHRLRRRISDAWETLRYGHAEDDLDY